METIRYFAYGSNMLLARLQARCPSAVFQCTASLEGYVITFTKKSVDGSGKATLTRVVERNAYVLGVVFELSCEDRERLDRLEGVGVGYHRVDDFLVVADADGKDLTVSTYVADQSYIDPSLSPYDWYLALVVSGAEKSGFAKEYVDALRNVVWKPDPDPKRKSKLDALDLLGGPLGVEKILQTGMNQMELVLPSAEYKRSFIEAVTEYQQEGGSDDRSKRYADLSVSALGSDFDAYIENEKSHALGKNLPAGYVPETTYWLVDGSEFIGRVSIRHRLTEHLRQIGGLIGYDIRPSKRKHGYGTKILELALPKAKEIGLRKVLVTCDATNIASRRIIEKNGGILENQVPNPETGIDKLRFRIGVD